MYRISINKNVDPIYVKYTVRKVLLRKWYVMVEGKVLDSNDDKKRDVR